MHATEPKTRNEIGVAQSRPAVERLFSLSGALPLPVALALHLGHELSRAFTADVSEQVRPPSSPFEAGVRLSLVIAPLIVHVVLGSYFLVGQRRLHGQRTPQSALAHSAIRVSGFLSLLFIGYHVADFGVPRWLGRADASDAGFQLVGRLSGTAAGVPVAALLYTFGLLVTMTHTAIGVHRALAAEGWLPSERGRLRSVRWCALGAALCFIAGAAAVIRVATGRLP